jgi:copper(I)-binding protein
MMFKAFFKPVALAALLAAATPAAAGGDLEISGAWLRAVPPVAATGW